MERPRVDGERSAIGQWRHGQRRRHVADEDGQDVARVERGELGVELEVLLARVADEDKPGVGKGLSGQSRACLLRRTEMIESTFCRLRAPAGCHRPLKSPVPRAYLRQVSFVALALHAQLEDELARRQTRCRDECTNDTGKFVGRVGDVAAMSDGVTLCTTH